LWMGVGVWERGGGGGGGGRKGGGGGGGGEAGGDWAEVVEVEKRIVEKKNESLPYSLLGGGR